MGKGNLTPLRAMGKGSLTHLRAMGKRNVNLTYLRVMHGHHLRGRQTL